MKKILVIGQLTMEPRRLEFGNIGNFYIVHGFFKELRRVFGEKVEIKTTLQLEDDFLTRYNLVQLPIECYAYGSANDAEIARAELVLSLIHI